MEIGKMYAVLTGDLIGSSRFTHNRENVLSALKNSFTKISPDIIESSFVVFRGDSFQGVLSMPDEALNAALTIRASLLSMFNGKGARLDARIAVGIGTIDYLSLDKAGEGDGEAFRNSGPALDRMKKGEQNIIIKTPWIEINKELIVECALLDALIQRWTKEQAEAIVYQFLKRELLGGTTPQDQVSVQEITQQAIAKILNISQPALSQRLKTGGSWAIEVFLERFKEIIRDKVRIL